MFNLLPLASQKSVSNEYRFRVASACIIALAVLVFLAGVSLIPAYVSSINQAKLFQAQYDSVHEVAGQKVDDSMAKLLGATKAKLDLSQPYLETSAASEMVSRVVEHQTAGIGPTRSRKGFGRGRSRLPVAQQTGSPSSISIKASRPRRNSNWSCCRYRISRNRPTSTLASRLFH